MIQPNPCPELVAPNMGVFKPHTFNTPPPFFCTVPKPLKVKSKNGEQAGSRGDLFAKGTLSASLQLCSTASTVHPSHTLNDCIRMGHHMYEGSIPILQRRENLRSS